MLASLSAVAALLVSMAFLMLGNGFQGVLLPLRAETEHFGTFSIGIMGSSYFIGFILGCLLTPHILRRSGHIRTFTAMVAGASALTLLHLLVIEPSLWALFRAGTGFCIAGLYVIIESWLNERTTNSTRGAIMSAYVMVNLSATMVGQMLVSVYAPQSFHAFALASVLVSVAAIPVALTRSPQPTPPQLVTFRLKKLYHNAPAAMVGAVVIGLANGPLWTLGPLYATQIGLDTEEAAIFMSIFMLAGALSQWPAGRLSDKVDRRLILSWLTLAACVFALILGLSQNLSHLEAFGLALCYGLAMMPGYSIACSHAYDHTEAGGYVEASGGLLLSYSAGAVIGPLLISPMMTWFGPGSLFIYCGFLFGGYTLYLAKRIGLRKALKPKHKEAFDFANTPVAGPVPPTPRISEQANGAVIEKTNSA